MEFNLTQGLADLSCTPPVAPLPADPVVHRVRRGRTIRTAAVGLASAAVIVGAAAIVYAAPWENPPPPAETPSPAPTIQPTPQPTPEPTPEPTPTPAATPPIIALTEDGALVELDPVSGEVLRTVATNEHWTDLALTADRTTAYLTTQDLSGPVTGPDWDEIQRVSLVDGASEFVTAGARPAVSPDGRKLAYVGAIEVLNDFEEDPAHWYSRGLIVLDLTTGETTSVVDLGCVECGRALGTPRWAPDGSTVYMPVGWIDTWMGTSTVVVAITPGTTATIQDAPVIGPISDADWSRSWAAPAVLDDGRLLVSVTEASDAAVRAYDQTRDRSGFVDYVAVVNPTTGEEEQRINVPGVDAFAIAPDGNGLAMLDLWPEEWEEDPSYTLSVWDDGELRPLGEGYIAVAW